MPAMQKLCWQLFSNYLGGTAHEIQSLSLRNKILSTLISGSFGTSDISELLNNILYSYYLAMGN